MLLVFCLCWSDQDFGIYKSSDMTNRLFTCGGKETFRNSLSSVLGSFFSYCGGAKIPHIQHSYNLLLMRYPLRMVSQDGRLYFLKHTFGENFAEEEMLKYTFL